MLETFGRWLGIRTGEWPRTAGMFLYLLMAVGAFVTGRISRDALFLSRYDITYLPHMYIWVALAVALTSYFYSQFADRFRRDRLIQFVTAFLLTGVVASRFLLMTGDWMVPGLYIFIEVMGGLLMIQFWTFANDIFTTREAKRLFGLIGAGGVTATILAGFAVGGLADWIGTENLLVICGVLLLGCLLVVTSLGRTCRRELTLAMTGSQTGRGISLASDLGRVFASKHLKTIAWITLLTFLAVTIVDYQFKVLARYTYLNREDQLSGFFGWFYAASGAISFLIQFLVTGKLLQRFGVIVSLLLMPVAMLAGSVMLLVIPGLMAALVLKGSENVLRYTVNDTTTQILYLPVPSNIRGRAKAFIGGMLRPLAQGLCGVVLAWTGSWVGHRVDWLGVGSIVSLTILMMLILGLKKEYVQSLMNTLKRRRIHFGETSLSISDSHAVAALEETLTDSNEHNVLHALEMIQFVQRHDWSKNLGKLLAHASTDVRLQALRLLARENPVLHMESILDLLNDEDQRIRAEAVNLYCIALKEKAMGAVEPLLKDSSHLVRAAATVGLIRYGGLDGIIVAADTLKAMFAAQDAKRRRAGAWCVGQVGVKTFYRSLMPLMADPDSSVRTAAVQAAGALRSPELVLGLIQRLSDPPVQRSAITALAAYGPGLLTTLRTILDNPREQPMIRRAIPNVLSRIGVQLSMDVLFNILDTEETVLRTRALDAIVHLHVSHPELRPDREMLRRLVHRELKSAYQTVVMLTETVSIPSMLLSEANEERYVQTLGRIFKLLRVLHPGRQLDVVRRNLNNPLPSAKANAVEVLEQVLDPETRRCLLPLLELSDRVALVATGAELFPLMHREPAGWLHEFLVDKHEWTVATALEAIGRLADSSFEPAVRLLLGHSSPLVRETAAFCLEKLTSPESLAEAIAHLASDPNPRVRSAVLWLRPALASE